MTEESLAVGTVFSVPLKIDEIVIGVVINEVQTLATGYFFIDDNKVCYNALNYKEAFAALRFNSSPIIEKEWPIVAVIENWDKTDWPNPYFYQFDLFGSGTLGHVLQFDEQQPFSEIYRRPANQEDIKKYQTDGICYSGAVEDRLLKLLT